MRPSPLRPVDTLFGFDAGRAVGRHEGYVRGHRAGYDVGYRTGRDHERTERQMADDTARDAVCRDVASAATTYMAADNLAARRGDTDRAQQLDQLFRTRGIRVSERAEREPATKPYVDAAMVERCLASWDVATVSAA